MSKLFQIHPENPQHRLINQAVAIIKEGGVLSYPTDSAYAIGCQLDDKKALDRICEIRKLDKKHNFTLICRDLSEISKYAIISTPVFRFLKLKTPGPYTFILKATKEIPRRLLHPKRKTIGLRIPANNIVQALLEKLGEPMLTTSLILPEDESPLIDPLEIQDKAGHQLDLVIDGGFCGDTPTTMIDLLDDEPRIIRQGKEG